MPTAHLTPRPTAPAPAAVADALKKRWRAGGNPDAAAALRAHPALLGYQSVVVDLAYEEFCLREEAGAAPDADAFAARFPAFRSAVREVLRAHVWLAGQPGLLPADPRWPRPGDVVEGYEVVGEVARGAFARVYLAADPQVGRHVVLKVAPGGSGEARALGMVRHPHVIDVYWAKPVGDLSVICMPFVAAATLQDVCDAAGPPAGATVLAAVARAEAAYAGLLPAAGQPVLTGDEGSADAVAAIARRVADALAALHRAGVVHADLKPSNVLVAAGGHPYLIDFNLAAGRDADRLRVGGTLPYMPPEQLRGLAGGPPAGVSPRADVFAFGVLVYQLAAGRLPFDPGPPSDARAVAEHLLAQHQAGLNPRAIASLPVPRPLAELVGRCLSPDPAARPADGNELARALRGTVSRPPRVWRRPWGAVAAVAAVVSVAGLAPLTFPGREAAAPPPASGAPVPPADPFERGRYYLGLASPNPANVRLALDSFGESYAGRKDGPTAANFSYCCGLMGQSKEAADYASEAITLGCDTAAVRNNLAYNLVSASGKNTDRAVAHLTVALNKNSRLRAARYNMATTLLKRDLDQDHLRLKNGLACVDHMDKALELGPDNAHLCFDAARIYAAAYHQDRAKRDYLDRALSCVRRAIELGKNRAQIRGDIVLWRVLKDVPEFGTILDTTVPATDQPGTNVHLVLVDPGRGE